ncbi:Cro/CI family transcriptional regulator [Flagellatimonas centrodinii]|uniref:Cro/CI family transcriptional regulator n=1 Tax=Flagellatimonas centrodinii TaxID=2806210 RepID=UPI003450A9D4
MTKADAIAHFKGAARLASAIGCSRQAVHQWPPELPDRIADRVIAAITRSGLEVPPELMPSESGGADVCSQM